MGGELNCSETRGGFHASLGREPVRNGADNSPAARGRPSTSAFVEAELEPGFVASL